MKRFIVFVVSLLFFPLFSFASDDFKKVEEGVTAAMQVNFEACNREDIKSVMDSCAVEMPDRDKFERETIDVFEEKDIYYRLVSCDLIEVKFPYALAKIVQETHLKDRSASDKKQLYYRNSSALVPEEECVEYLNTFKCEDGVWKLLVIVSEMKAVNREQQSNEQ